MTYTNTSLEQQHPIYKQQLSDWQFYMDSYSGGETYKSKNYLTRYKFETDTAYTARIKYSIYLLLFRKLYK